MYSRKWLYWNCLGSLSPRLRCAITGHRISPQVIAPTASAANTDQLQNSRIRLPCGVIAFGQPKPTTSLPEHPVAVRATSPTRPTILARRPDTAAPPRDWVIPLIPARSLSQRPGAHRARAGPNRPANWLADPGAP